MLEERVGDGIGGAQGGERYRFLLACWPFPGHIRPFLSLAAALRDAGHQVAIYTGSTAAEQVAAQSVDFFPFQHVDEQGAYDSISAIDSMPAGGRPSARLIARIFRDWMVETIPAQLEDLEPLARDWRPDVIVSETAMWGPMLVLWEKLGLPVAIQSTMLVCLIPGPDAPPAGFGMGPPRTVGDRLKQRAIVAGGKVLGRGMRRRVDEIRAGHGLAPLDVSLNAFAGKLPLYLIGGLRQFDFDRHDLPPSVHYVGPYLPRQDHGSPPPDWLAGIRRDLAWIHVTESTLRYGDPFLIRTATHGLSGGPYEVILTTGQQRTPAELRLGPIADNIHLVQWIDHSVLLPRCAAVVSSGGAGTIMAAMRAGIPQVVVPTTWDKPDNARRLVESGVGLSLAPDQCTPERLRTTVEEVISDPRYRTRARELAEQLAAAPGPGGAVELLESLAASRRPAV